LSLVLAPPPLPDWPALYDVAKLEQNKVPVAAATYYEVWLLCSGVM
jgi:hypothetical protein